MSKKRILWISEASFMATGFSVLSYEILKRLYDTGKYEIAELGAYAQHNDPRQYNLPWKFYPGIPSPDNAIGLERYNNSIYGQFGEAVFEQVCLDFKPDICIDSRDYWMCEFELRSPYRDRYKLLWMPTIDGEPQRLEWLDSYSRVDGILTYSEYGKRVLEREAPNKVNVLGVVRPGVNHEMYKPMDKSLVRKYFGLSDDMNIIMTVMRNQKRKLFPDLIESFAEFLKYCVKNNNEELAQKTYLYLHTSYPDVGFDIGRHIMDKGVGHKVLCTYICEACKSYYPDFFQSELTSCKKCCKFAAHMPNTQLGVKREELANIINLADLYIQYSTCEGLGMPVAEAKACGVPAMGVEYSATEEQVQPEFGCMPIKVGKFFYESVIETEQRRSLPDTQDTVEKIYKFFTLAKEEKEELSKLARQDAENNYSFDRSAKIFESAIDSIKIDTKPWDDPIPEVSPLNMNIPQFQNNADFIDWCIDNILGKPKLKDTYWRNELIKGLNVGFSTGKGGREKFDHDIAINMFTQMAKSNDFWENVRVKPFLESNGNKWEIL